MVFVDTNVLIDVDTNNPAWSSWSLEALETASLDAPLVVDSVVFAELCATFETMAEVETFLRQLGVGIRATPQPALFLAAKAFATYRRQGGTRTGVLPDFFIGAHAAVEDAVLVTRDPKRFRTYFPAVALITPAGDL